MAKNIKVKEFDPKDFKGKVNWEDAKKMGYGFDQLNKLVDQGKLYHGSYLMAESNGHVHHEYSTNPNKVTKITGHVYI